MSSLIYELPLDTPIRWESLFALQARIEQAGVEPVERSIARVHDELSRYFDCISSAVIFAVRVSGARNDLLGGWRVAWMHRPTSPRLSKVINLATRTLQWQREDVATLGRFGERRAGAQVLSETNNNSQRRLARLLNIEYRLGAALPMSENIELFFALERTRRGRPFNEEEIAHALALLQVMKPIAGRWCRMLGVWDGAVLSPREQEALVLLLQGHSEKIGAYELGLAVGSFHQIVVRIYRKLSVGSRAELMSKFFIDSANTGERWTGRIIRNTKAHPLPTSDE